MTKAKQEKVQELDQEIKLINKEMPNFHKSFKKALKEAYNVEEKRDKAIDIFYKMKFWEKEFEERRKELKELLNKYKKDEFFTCSEEAIKNHIKWMDEYSASLKRYHDSFNIRWLVEGVQAKEDKKELRYFYNYLKKMREDIEIFPKKKKIVEYNLNRLDELCNKKKRRLRSVFSHLIRSGYVKWDIHCIEKDLEKKDPELFKRNNINVEEIKEELKVAKIKHKEMEDYNNNCRTKYAEFFNTDYGSVNSDSYNAITLEDYVEDDNKS